MKTLSREGVADLVTMLLKAGARVYLQQFPDSHCVKSDSHFLSEDNIEVTPGDYIVFKVLNHQVVSLPLVISKDASLQICGYYTDDLTFVKA